MRRLTQELALLVGVAVAPQGLAQNPNDPGILDPMFSAMVGSDVRIPHTDQAAGGQQLNLIGPVVEHDAEGQLSLMGHPIVLVESPNEGLCRAVSELSVYANGGDSAGMLLAAEELEAILLGTTQGRIYDGFPMLNYNQGGVAPGQVPGEYKMKVLTNTGLTEPGMDGRSRVIWEVDVNFLWYDSQFDSDTFLLRVPIDAHALDTLRVNFRIYSLVREDFSPTGVVMDHRNPASVQFPFKGLDSVWTQVGVDSVTELTVAFPPLSLQRGVYTWGWREHPPRIQFLQPIFEMINAHTGSVQLDPQGESYATRNRGLSIAGIGAAAPEMKLHTVAQAVLAGATPQQVLGMLEDEHIAPRGVLEDWCDLLEDQRALPPEAWDVLTAEGIDQDSFGPYDFVSVYLNNEMYGEGPRGDRIRGWDQGDSLRVKVINLDEHSHYYRLVDFGPKLHDDIRSNFSSGSHSFEIMSIKPAYGAPKVAEMQWRAGWGFRPHYDVIQQPDVFPRPVDEERLSPYLDGHDHVRLGYQYSTSARGGDFRFNPPPFIIGSTAHPSPSRLREGDGTQGLVIGQMTEGYGVAKMCSHRQHPLGSFCETDISAFNPYGAKNIDTDGDGNPDVLWFPPFLRNPNPAGGDIIPPTGAWKTFLWINPANGTLFIDPANPGAGYWADLTYAHGRPVPAMGDISTEVEAPRASGQVFYQFDDLFHDNAIFSPHPTSSEPVRDR